MQKKSRVRFEVTSFDSKGQLLCVRARDLDHAERIAAELLGVPSDHLIAARAPTCARRAGRFVAKKTVKE